MTLGNVITIAVVVAGVIFGYGDLNSKVNTLISVADKQTEIDTAQNNRMGSIENSARAQELQNGQSLARLEADMRYVRESITDIRTTMRENIPRVN